MATFRARDRSSAVLRSPRSEVWAALTDADLIAQITPYVTGIDVEGDRWTWRLATLPVLGISVAPKFTEVMDLHPQDRIVFTHDPDRPDEMTAVNGTYDLTDHADGGTDVSIVQKGIPDSIPVEFCYLGWQESLEMLAKLVEPEIPDGA